jgi:hypothetical protein
LAVIASLSEALEIAPADLGPLHHAVDGDALNKLLRVQGSPDGDVSVTFTAEGHTITVHNNGSVSLTPLGDNKKTGDLRE